MTDEQKTALEMMASAAGGDEFPEACRRVYGTMGIGPGSMEAAMFMRAVGIAYERGRMQALAPQSMNQTTYCSSCDGKLEVYLFPGRQAFYCWCADCEVGSIWGPGQEVDGEDESKGLGPERQLLNVAKVLLAHTEVKRQHNGRGRSATYAADTDAIAQTGRQLAEMVIQHLQGELAPIANDELPF